ncbi:putative RNA-directed DNA polymerase from transposon X-element [Trichonephila clavipes]|nr:putative RNA-directed DNA polymerase from transposon X-element [Trichonephila clavipes]
MLRILRLEKRIREQSDVTQYKVYFVVVSYTGSTTTEDLSSCSTFISTLKIGFWNANSLRNKIHEVRDFVHEQNLDLFLVQETWLEPGIDPQIANYRFFKDDRIEFAQTVTRVGMAIYCISEIVHNRVPLPEILEMDATAVQIKIKNFPPINIVSAYVRIRVRQNFSKEDFKTIFNSDSDCIIAGDYNAAHVNWHNAKSTRYGVTICNLIRNLRGARLVASQTATHLHRASGVEVLSTWLC